MSLLEIHSLRVQYGRLVALRGVSLSVDEGEVACIVGPNGAGKSTTLNAISGVLPTVSGDVVFEGRSLVGATPEEVAARGIAQVPEGRHIFTTMTVEENLRVGAALRRDSAGVDRDHQRVLDIFPVLASRSRQMAGKLSGGEQQMLAIGRALMSQPRFIMIDEPSLGLAPQLVDRVYEVLLDLRTSRGLTLLIVEQSSERALVAGDRVYVLRNGEVQLSGAATDLRDGEAVKQAYFGFGDTRSASEEVS